MIEAFTQEISWSVQRIIDEKFQKLLENYTRDDKFFVSVDGEEGDYGVTRYLLEGECILVEFNHAGDDIEYIHTKYGYEKFIRPMFNFELDIEYLIDASQENCLSHYCKRDLEKLLRTFKSKEFVNESTHLNAGEKASIIRLIEKLETQAKKVKP